MRDIAPSCGPQNGVPLADLRLTREEAAAALSNRSRPGGPSLKRTYPEQQALAGVQADFDRWHDYNVTLLQKLYVDSSVAAGYKHSGISVGGGFSATRVIAQLRKRVAGRINALESLSDQPIS